MFELKNTLTYYALILFLKQIKDKNKEFESQINSEKQIFKENVQVLSNDLLNSINSITKNIIIN